MGDHLARASFPCQSKNEVGLYFGIAGSYVERILEMIDRCVQAAAFSQLLSKPIMRHKIPRGHGEGVPPERLTVAPVGSLDMSAPGQCKNGDGSRHCQNSALKSTMADSSCGEPGSQGVCSSPR